MDEKSNIDLRDYFAAQCLRKVGSFPEHLLIEIDGGFREAEMVRFKKYIKLVAELSYQMADALIAERNKNA